MPEIGNWIAELTETTGTDDITLGGPIGDGFVRFQDVVVAGEVFYAINNGVSREAGIGEFNGIDRLVRTLVVATYENGIYNDNDPSPIFLSGHATVSCAFNAQAFRDIWDHVGDTNNPHDTTAVKVPYDPSGDPATAAEDVQAALSGHGNIIDGNTGNILINAENIATNTENIAINTGDIATNTGNIATNTENISKNTGSGSGTVFGGELSATVGGTTFSVTAGTGNIYNSYGDPEVTDKIEVTWAAFIDVDLVIAKEVGRVAIFLTPEGSILQVSGPPTGALFRGNIFLGVIYFTSALNITEVANAPSIIRQTSTDAYDALREGVGVEGGAVFGVIDNLQVWQGEATITFPGVNWLVDQTNPNIASVEAVGSDTVPLVFSSFTRNAVPVDIGITDIPKTYNPVDDTVTALTGTQATIHRLYRVGINDPVFFLLLGQNLYNSASEALDQAFLDENTTEFPDETSDLFFAGYVCVSFGALDFVDPNLAWIISATTGQSSAGAAISKSHTILIDRDQPNQHPIDAIEGLIAALDAKYDKTGGVVSGAVTVSYGGSPRVVVHPVTTDGFPQVALKDAAGQDRSLLYFDNITGRTVLRRISALGEVETNLTLDTGGNVMVNGLLPTEPAHVTRKDFVESHLMTRTNDKLPLATSTYGDFNLDRIGGFYQKGNTADNNPGGWGVLLVQSRSMSPGGERAVQMFMEDDDKKVWYRSATANWVWKDWVQLVDTDDLFKKFDKTGGTLTGNIEVHNGSTPAVSLRAASSGGHPQVNLRDTNNVTRGMLFVAGDPAATEMTLRKHDNTGAITCILNLQDNGNISVNGTAPVGASDLTRKDWVEALVAGADAFPVGTRMMFAQSAPPTGWAQDTSDTANDRMLRVVNFAGGGVSGSHSPILMNVVPAHTHVASTNNTGAHTHNSSGGNFLKDGGGGFGYASENANNNLAAFSATSSNGNHTHTVTVNNNTGAANWTPRYLNLVIGVKS